MRFGLVALALTLATPAFAQPLPDTIRSANLTQAQADELNRRLSALSGRFNALAGETHLREAAVRNIAVEIFGAQPNLDFETYATLIDNGARELRKLVTEARGRTETDPELAALRAQAIAAAEEGRLTEARTRYDQLIARSTESLEARWAREDAARSAERRAATLAVAADMAEAARLAFAAADYLDAARRYGEAAERAPEGTRERWQYTIERANALFEAGYETQEDAVDVYRQAILLRPRSRAPADWAITQEALATALFLLEREQDSDAAFQAALSVRTRRNMPLQWAETMIRIGNLHANRALLGDSESREEGIAAYRAALGVLTRAETPIDWAETQRALGNILDTVDDRRLDEAIRAYRSALEVFTREALPREWATTQYDLGLALHLQGNASAVRSAIACYRLAAEVITYSERPGAWLNLQSDLGQALLLLGEDADRSALSEAEAIFERLLEIYETSTSFRKYETKVQLALVYRAQVRAGDRARLPTALTAMRSALSDIENLWYMANQANRLRTHIAELEALQ